MSEPLPRLGDKTGQPLEIEEDTGPVEYVCWRCKNPTPTAREFCPASDIGAPCMGTKVRVQACRPGDREILQTEAGRNLVTAAVAQMRAEPTPGPWEISSFDSIIAQFPEMGWIGIAHVHDYKSSRAANSRLIAAAPDLLKAVQMVVTACGHHSNWDGWTRDFLIACESALAKAQR